MLQRLRLTPASKCAISEKGGGAVVENILFWKKTRIFKFITLLLEILEDILFGNILEF